MKDERRKEKGERRDQSDKSDKSEVADNAQAALADNADTDNAVIRPRSCLLGLLGLSRPLKSPPIYSL